MDFIPNENELPEIPEPKPLGRPKGSFKKKFTKAEQKAFMNESIRVVFNEHLSHREYVDWVSKNYGISHTQAGNYWTQIWATVQRKFDHDKDKLILKHIASYWDIHSRAITNGDLTNARQSLNDIAKLIGLNEAEKVKVEHQVIRLNFGGTDEN